VNITAQTEQVLRVFLEDIQQSRYGYELMRRTGLKSGTLYPMLSRFEADGLIKATWEESTQPGRPPRRIYTLAGAAAVETVRHELAQASLSARAGRGALRPRPHANGYST
jgi:DNA-binding PadR family transcriptional regulator